VPLITNDTDFGKNRVEKAKATFRLRAGYLSTNDRFSTRGEKVEMERDVSHEGKGSNTRVPSRHKVESVLSIDLYRELSKAPSRGAKN
jgi:hypothetical protein